jgi:hypothetical protein
MFHSAGRTMSHRCCLRLNLRDVTRIEGCPSGQPAIVVNVTNTCIVPPMINKRLCQHLKGGLDVGRDFSPCTAIARTQTKVPTIKSSLSTPNSLSFRAMTAAHGNEVTDEPWMPQERRAAKDSSKAQARFEPKRLRICFQISFLGRSWRHGAGLDRSQNPNPSLRGPRPRAETMTGAGRESNYG